MSEIDDTQEYPRIDYAERRRERALQRAQQSKGRQWLLVAAAVVALIVLLVTVEVASSVGRIHPGVTVAGVEVGGMVPSRAVGELNRELARRAAEPVVLTAGDKAWKIEAEQVGVTFDTEAAVAQAMEVGRDEAVLVSLSERVTAWTKGIDVPAAGAVDPEKYDAALKAVTDHTDVKPVDSKVKIESGEVSVVPGSDGRALDKAATAQALVRGFASDGENSVEAPVVVAKMRVTEAAAEDAAKTVRAMLSEPVTITHEDKTWKFSPEKIGDWVSFKVIDSATASSGATASARLEPYIDAKKAKKPVTQALGSGVGRPAKDATFKTNNGRVTIIPSQDGLGPDVDSLALALTEELKSPSGERIVELRTTRTEPKITTADAKKMGIRERIASYTTTYEPGNRARVNNIHLLGDALNGTLIKPGGVFSFNGAAGERTAEKGYQEAAAIVNGKLVPQLGGGVCQVGTTVFNAVFESGLPVIERRNHSFYISHYPTGRDATVSWGGPDLKFKNDTKHWVLVSVSYTPSSITVALYGTDPGYDVEAKVGEWTNSRPYPTETKKDPMLAEGMKVIEDSGVSGRSIEVKRIVTKDGKVVRTDTFVSNYRPKAQVVRVGTKKPKQLADKPAKTTE